MVAHALSSCRVCGSFSIGKPVTAREMMFGTREAFTYWPCRDCGTLQIGEFPYDMARYYPSGSYYSFNDSRRISPLRRAVLRVVAAHMVGRPARAPLGGGFFDRLKYLAQPWIAYVPGLRRDSQILDVGSGEGAKLEGLAMLGFTNLTGCDPYMPEARAGHTASGVQMLRCDLAEVDGRFDLITMHHSLEHFADPGVMLELARDRLAKGGRILVGVPLMQPWCWERFGVDWAQLDAPRHFYLFTDRALVGLAKRSGLRCTAHGYNSLGWVLAWSEIYARDIPMYAPDGTPNPLPFDKAQMAAFDAGARRMNAAREGDSGWFVLEAG